MSEEMNGAPEGVTEDTAAALDTSAEETTQAQGDEQSGDDAAAAEAEGEGKQPKPRRSAQERIDQAIRAQREAEREAEFWRSKAIQPTPTAQPQAQGDGKPDPADFDGGAYDPGYIDALTDWKAEQAVEKRFSEREAKTRTQTALQTFEQRVAEQFPEGEPDGLRTILSMPTLSSVVQEVVMESEIGPKLADHLGDNPRELRRISALPPIQQARELTKLELKLATPPAPTAKTATDAPAPTPQVRGAGGRFTVPPDTDDFAAFEKQYGK